VTASDTDLAALAEESLAIGLTCGFADRARAEAGVRRAYEQAGLPAPRLMLWFGSPAAGAIAVAMLRIGDYGDHAVRDALLAQGARPGINEIGGSVRALIRTRPWAQARSSLHARLGAVGFARHWAATARRPWQQIVDQIASPLRTRLDARFAAETGDRPAAAREALLDAILGQHDAAWLGAFDDADHDLSGLAEVARSAGWWWAFENVAVLTERPTEAHRDNLGRLHHGEGAALSYPDGFGLHAWRGMPIPPEVAAELATLTIDRIQSETNAEVRRVMLEHFGFDRYLRESGAAKSHSDETGTLWRVPIPGDEPLVMVEVLNASPEPDGTFRTYFLRVPPSVRTAREGVAWTFDLSAEDYAPLQQT
jgi:hypothetical protein